jgi:hypothetical protein
MSDCAPQCQHCRASTIFGFGVMPNNSPTAIAQCGGCHCVDYFRVTDAPRTAQEFVDAYRLANQMQAY